MKTLKRLFDDGVKMFMLVIIDGYRAWVYDHYASKQEAEDDAAVLASPSIECCVVNVY